MVMPELKYCSISCHIPGFGFRKGSSSLVTALPDLPIPQAIKTCKYTIWLFRSTCQPPQMQLPSKYLPNFSGVENLVQQGKGDKRSSIQY